MNVILLEMGCKGTKKSQSDAHSPWDFKFY